MGEHKLASATLPQSQCASLSFLTTQLRRIGERTVALATLHSNRGNSRTVHQTLWSQLDRIRSTPGNPISYQCTTARRTEIQCFEMLIWDLGLGVVRAIIWMNDAAGWSVEVIEELRDWLVDSFRQFLEVDLEVVDYCQCREETCISSFEFCRD
ncbi:hypothetical protein DL98DRAFT_577663 [Cadophora sp. DSE1049]|nr:hypothetical protein DL98DRAFT_577663 [Cadophora sp. DSE1049]